MLVGLYPGEYARSRASTTARRRWERSHPGEAPPLLHANVATEQHLDAVVSHALATGTFPELSGLSIFGSTQWFPPTDLAYLLELVLRMRAGTSDPKDLDALDDVMRLIVLGQEQGLHLALMPD